MEKWQQKPQPRGFPGESSSHQFSGILRTEEHVKCRPQRMQQQNPESEKFHRTDGLVSSTDKLQGKMREMKEELTD